MHRLATIHNVTDDDDDDDGRHTVAIVRPLVRSAKNFKQYILKCEADVASNVTQSIIKRSAINEFQIRNLTRRGYDSVMRVLPPLS